MSIVRTSPTSWAVPYRCKASGRGSRFTLVLPFEACEGMRANCSWRSPSRPSARMLRFRRCHALAALHVPCGDNEIIGEIAERSSLRQAPRSSAPGTAWMLVCEERAQALRPRVHGYPDARHGRPRAALVVERYREAGRAAAIIATTANAYEEDRRARRRDGRIRREAHREKRVCHLFATFVDAKIDK
ncbi:MAG: hypothetical protein ACLT98_13330 [Eggerthellaceae bacterium]